MAETHNVMDSTLIIDVIGWTGAGMLLIAYALVSLKGYGGTSNVYQCLNIAGSAFLIVSRVTTSILQPS